MTSRQPDATPPGTTGQTAITLLILVGLAGLGGEISGLQWNGPLHSHAVPVGLALEVVLGTLLVITIWRLATGAQAGTVKAAPARAVAVRLRWVLVVVLSAAMIAVAVTMLAGQSRHVFSGSPRTRPGQAGSLTPSSPATQPGRHFPFSLHLHVPAALLYGLLVLLFLGGATVRIWWIQRFRRYRSSGRIRAVHSIATDPQDLREAVESGRSALRAVDDARAAIIACYLAMEASLAERGAARAIADTPDELLARATAAGIVRGTAAARLTVLFYEARFSSHPLDRGQRDAAGQALGELAAALAEAGAAGTQAGRRRANRTGARA